jgi:dTDP-4-dehydrorhamnose 3,5-epimerase
MGLIDGVVVTPLKVVHVAGGDVFHAVKKGDPGFAGFGEAYFSTIGQGVIKPWKRHRQMTLNLVVISGLIRFVVHDDRPASLSCGRTGEFRVGLPDAYGRLTIAPGLWMAFQGIGQGTNILLNVADIPHDPTETDRSDIEKFAFDWDKT